MKIKIKLLVLILLNISLLYSCNNYNKENNTLSNDSITENSINLDSSVEETISLDDAIVNETELLNNLVDLSTNIRNYGSEGDVITSNNIKKKLTEYGYHVDFDKFNVYKQDFKSTAIVSSNLEFLDTNPYNSEILGKSNNIIANKNNLNSNKKTLYFTAHYDSTDNTIGIIDNASGSAVILELARLLKDYTNPYFNIGFIFFGAEEYYRFGSRYLVSNLNTDEKNNILGCINIDMVGEINSGNIIMETVGARPNIISLMLNNTFELQSGGNSDDLSLYMGKIPVVTLTDEKSTPDISLENNPIQYIDISKLKTICESIIEFISNFDLSIYNTTKSYTETYPKSSFNALTDFILIEETYNLLDNGYDSELEYTYRNNNNLEYTIKLLDSKFIDKNNLVDMHIFDTYNLCGYKILDSNETKINFNLFGWFGEISGDLSVDDALIIIKNYYNSAYNNSLK